MAQRHAPPLDLSTLLRDVPGRKDFMRPVAPLTAIRIGGPADALVRLETVAALRCLQAVAREHAIPLFILGGGSNLLIRDGGIRGIVVLLGLAIHYRAWRCNWRGRGGVVLNSPMAFQAPWGARW